LCFYAAFLFAMRITLIRYENPLLLALAGKHVQFKEFVASSLGSLSKLDFAAALKSTHSARTIAIQMADDASKGERSLRACSCSNACCASAAMCKCQRFSHRSFW
jgi:hypothetical protein